MKSSTVKPPKIDTSVPAVHWPMLPFFQSSAPTPDRSRECRIELVAGGTLVADLVRFEPDASAIEVRRATLTESVCIGLDQIRLMRLTDPLGLVPDQLMLDAIGPSAVEAARQQAFTITLDDQTRITGTTLGVVNDKRGLFLFLVEYDGSLAFGQFIPRQRLRNIQSTPLRDAAPAPPPALVAITVLEPDLEPVLEPEPVPRSAFEAPPESLALDMVEFQLSIDGPEMPVSQNPEHIAAFLTGRTVTTSDELSSALVKQRRQPNTRLGDVLLEAKLISQTQLDAALAVQSKQRGRRLGDILIEQGSASMRVIQMALAEKLGIPYVNVSQLKIDVATLDLVDSAFAVRNGVLPVLRTPDSLIIAVENPLAVDFLQDLRFATDLSIVAVMADPDELKARISKEYARRGGRGSDVIGMTGPSIAVVKESASDMSNVEDLYSQLSRESPTPVAASKPREIDQRVSDNTLVRLINKVIVEAHTQGASDIHIESNPGSGHTRIRFRKDGELEDYLDLPPAYRNALVSRIKIMAELNIAEHRQPQDGKIEFGKFGPLPIELRVAIVPTANNLEDVVLRILSGMEPLPLERLGFSERDLRELKRMINQNCGLILVCGPTGSGKTTTLHSALHDINKPDIKIWTAEDPIEITQPGLRQVQVQPKIDWTFAAAMRAFLRADPDVIMVGEMRDNETTKVGIEASLTGHLVFSTLHTNSAAESVVRLLDLGMDPFNFADALIGILSQRLARTLCSKCKRSHVATEKEVADLLEEYCADTALVPTEVLDRWKTSYGTAGGLTLFEAVGCSECRKGYKGRIGVYELLVCNSKVKDLVRGRGTVPQIAQAAVEGGMRLLKHDAIEKVWGGMLDLYGARMASS